MKGTETRNDDYFRDQLFTLHFNNGRSDPLEVTTTFLKMADTSLTRLQVTFDLSDGFANHPLSKLRGYTIVFSDNTLDHYTVPAGDNEGCTVNIKGKGLDVNNIIAYYN